MIMFIHLDMSRAGAAVDTDRTAPVALRSRGDGCTSGGRWQGGEGVAGFLLSVNAYLDNPKSRVEPTT